MSLSVTAAKGGIYTQRNQRAGYLPFQPHTPAPCRLWVCVGGVSHQVVVAWCGVRGVVAPLSPLAQGRLPVWSRSEVVFGDFRPSFSAVCWLLQPRYRHLGVQMLRCPLFGCRPCRGFGPGAMLACAWCPSDGRVPVAGRPRGFRVRCPQHLWLQCIWGGWDCVCGGGVSVV